MFFIPSTLLLSCTVFTEMDDESHDCTGNKCIINGHVHAIIIVTFLTEEFQDLNISELVEWQLSDVEEELPLSKELGDGKINIILLSC